jgi:hypothetical protein
VAQQKKIGYRKVQNMHFGSAKWFSPSIFPQDVDAGKGQQSLPAAIDWLGSLIGPGNLTTICC